MSDQAMIQKAYPIIHKLAKSRSKNGAFAYYERSDIYQEIWRLCLEAMDRYDETRGPIENYLVRHVTNRMKNLKRDTYFRPGFDASTSGMAKTRMNLVNALPFGHGDIAERGTLLGTTPINIDPMEFALQEETLLYIRTKLPEELLEPFETMIGNNNLRQPLADEIRAKVAEIMDERDQDV